MPGRGNKQVPDRDVELPRRGWQSIARAASPAGRPQIKPDVTVPGVALSKRTRNEPDTPCSVAASAAGAPTTSVATATNARDPVLHPAARPTHNGHDPPFALAFPGRRTDYTVEVVCRVRRRGAAGPRRDPGRREEVVVDGAGGCDVTTERAQPDLAPDTFVAYSDGVGNQAFTVAAAGLPDSAVIFAYMANRRVRLGDGDRRWLSISALLGMRVTSISTVSVCSTASGPRKSSLVRAVGFEVNPVVTIDLVDEKRGAAARSSSSNSTAMPLPTKWLQRPSHRGSIRRGGPFRGVMRRCNGQLLS